MRARTRSTRNGITVTYEDEYTEAAVSGENGILRFYAQAEDNVDPTVALTLEREGKFVTVHFSRTAWEQIGQAYNNVYPRSSKPRPTRETFGLRKS